MLRLDELDEAEALPLEDLALPLRDEAVDLFARPLRGVGGGRSGRVGSARGEEGAEAGSKSRC